MAELSSHSLLLLPLISAFITLIFLRKKGNIAALLSVATAGGILVFASSLIWEQLLHWNHQLVSTLFGLALIALGLSIKIKELKGLSYSSIVIGLIFSLGVLFVGIVLIPIINYL